MQKRMKVMLIGVGILFGAIFLYKGIMAWMNKRFMANQSKVVTVSAMKVGFSPWQTELSATGSLRAIRGVDVTTELAGMVQTIYFTPGANVTAGEILVQLNADNDVALLHSLEANAELANITYERDKAQYAIQAVSKQTLDADFANLKSLQAQVAQQKAIVAKKTIRAPFTGRLGINLVNPGQYVNPGDKVVTLQTLDPIYIDFYMPQQHLAKLKVGQQVTVTTDTFANKTFKGKITTIDPAVDPSTRNVQVEATIINSEQELAPGMFATLDIIIGAPKRYLTLPQTAVTFNPYGDIVYIIREEGKDKKNQSLIAKQAFVITGQTRGDQITVLKGLKEGDTIVTSGQLKLKNDTPVAINNSVQPSNNPAPVLPDEH